MSDLELGKKVLKFFYDWNKNLYPKSFTISFEQFLASYGSKINIYLDGIGTGARLTGMNDRQLDSSMKNLALDSSGRIPKDYQVYFKYLSDQAVKINWVDAVGFVAIESTKDVLTGAQAVGDSLITTGKIITFIFPVVALMFLYFMLDNKSGGRFAKAFK